MSGKSVQGRTVEFRAPADQIDWCLARWQQLVDKVTCLRGDVADRWPLEPALFESENPHAGVAQSVR